MADLPGKICTSCGKLSNSYAEFRCPKCGETSIVRCYSCREKHNTYRCTSCATEGP
jgi:predicted RNA-binding Zn-ribbon protein involved in translation (DUF1610 family)